MKSYSKAELDNIRGAGKILSAALDFAGGLVRDGISTLEIDAAVEEFILSEGGVPSFKNYKGYGFATCISVNEEIVHGKPRANKVLTEGDIVSIDVGVRWNGFCADAARTFPVGEISQEDRDLIFHTEQCFHEAVKTLKAGALVGEIGRHIECYVKHNTTYSILETYFGHGIGRNVHEEPLIPNFVARTPQLRVIARKVLPAGVAICIEPMICAGGNEVKLKSDGWTVVTADGKRSAHYENTVIIKEDGVEVVT